MATFNRSEIMKSAWNIVRTAGKTISEGLKAAWAKAKNVMEKVEKVFTKTFEQWLEDTEDTTLGLTTPKYTVADFHADMESMPRLNIIEKTNEKVTYTIKPVFS